MKHRNLALIIPIAALVLLFTGCPSPNNEAVVTSADPVTAPAAASPNQQVTTLPPTAETISTPPTTPVQVSQPSGAQPTDTIFIPDCCDTGVPAS
jgi:PBP1b-binding outer membrane lipoprotein LpoB